MKRSLEDLNEGFFKGTSVDRRGAAKGIASRGCKVDIIYMII